MKFVRYQAKDRIAHITLMRGERQNALNLEMDQELAHAWELFAQDDRMEVAILSGQGPDFCVGLDLADLVDEWEKLDWLKQKKKQSLGIGGGLTRGRHRLAKPVIAAINGPALGAGLELALACDIRLASDQASFGVHAPYQGLHQADGGMMRLLLALGLGAALDLSLTGRRLSAPEALRMGLVSRIFAHDQLDEQAQVWAQMILSHHPKAVQGFKETLLDLVGKSLDEGLKLEAAHGYSSLGDIQTARDLWSTGLEDLANLQEVPRRSKRKKGHVA